MTYHCTRFIIFKIYKFSSLDCHLVLTPTLHKLWLAVGIFFLVYALTKRGGGGERDLVTPLKAAAGTQHSSDAPPSVLILTSMSPRISQ